jgi:hypothetical protein
MPIRTIIEFEDIMQPLIVRALGWDISSPDKSNDVRIGWQTEGVPTFGVNDNVVFITATPVDHQINRHHDLLLGNSSPDLLQTKSFTRVMAINVVAYGSDCISNLMAIKMAMFDDDYRTELAAEEIYLVPDIEEPRRMPEQFQNQWWERGDMQLKFNELLMENKQINGVDSVDVTIDNSNVVLTEFTVDQ